MKKIILLSVLVSAHFVCAQESVISYVSEKELVDAPLQDEELSDLFGEEHTELDTVHSPENGIEKSKIGLLSYVRVAFNYIYQGHVIPAYTKITNTFISFGQ